MTDVYPWYKEDDFISTAPCLLDIDAIHHALFYSSQAKGSDRETVTLLVNNSSCFGLYDKSKQIDFACLVTDYATFAYLCDVYIADDCHKNELGLW